jgi:CRISPR-associated endonuclease/helicase Cas3
MGKCQIDYSEYMAKSSMFGIKSESLLEHTNNVLDQVFILAQQYKLDGKLKSLLLIAAFFHDIGKINPVFQNRIKSQNRITFNSQIEIGHNVASIFAMRYLREHKDTISDTVKADKLPADLTIFCSVSELEVFAKEHEVSVFDMMVYYLKNLSRDEFTIVYYAVLEHHQYGENLISEVNDFGKVASFPFFAKGRDIDNRKIREKVKALNLSKIAPDNYQGQMLLISGFLNRCDRAASAHMQVEFPNDFLRSCIERWSINEKSKNPEFSWRPLQEYCFQNRDQNLLIIAPTGQGKTEAGLRWIGDDKAFFVLPLRTAINSIYDRISHNILQNKFLDNRIALLHGESLSVLMNKNQEDGDFQQLLKYDKNAKMFSLPLNITTPDQLFNYVFKHNDFELKLSLLANSKIIIDEIQAYSAELLAYLVYGLQLAASLGAKILILTATFPPFIRNLLDNDFRFTGSDISQRLKGIKFQEKRFISGPNRHYIKVESGILDQKSAGSLLKDLLDNSEYNSYLIVCNTISKANAIYETVENLISEDYPEQEFHLFHSKFAGRDRSSLEKKIIEHGKKHSKEKVIWVTTQVVEASLDIDFDCLITELSDLNSLFQRMGRVNRHALKLVKNPNCYVYAIIEEKYLKYSNCEKNSAFIDKQIHELSKKALKSFKGNALYQEGEILSEQDKQDLIDDFLAMDNLISDNNQSDFLEEYNAHYKFIETLIVRGRSSGLINKRFRNIVQIPIIPKVIYDESIFQAKKSELYSIRDQLKNRNETSDDSTRMRSKVYDLTNFIKSCCVNIQPYELKNLLKLPANKSKHIFVDLGYEQIQVLDCEYSAIKGFRYSSKNSAEDRTNEKFDSKENSDSNINNLDNIF